MRRDGTMAFGTGERFEIGIYRPAPGSGNVGADGLRSATLERVLRVEAPRLSVAQADLEAYRERFEFDDRTPQHRRDVYAEFLEEVEYPERWPAFERLEYDDRGRLWVLVPSHRGEPSLWNVFDRDGSRVARVEVPDGMRVHAIAGDRIYATLRNDLGVSYISVQEIVSAEEAADDATP